MHDISNIRILKFGCADSHFGCSYAQMPATENSARNPLRPNSPKNFNKIHRRTNQHNQLIHNSRYQTQHAYNSRD